MANILFKKSNFRKIDNFNCFDTIKFNKNTYLFYGKNKGKSNTLNKWTIPEFLKNKKYYGNIIVIKKSNNILLSLNKEDFNKFIIYDKEKEEIKLKNNKCEQKKERDSCMFCGLN